ncbi:MAG: DNA replication and repair protein RecF [Saprospiraceae bacterium]
MHLNRITLSKFKNFEQLNFEPNLGFNFIIGDNGIGKTNLLDAIHYCCMTKSFFHKSDKFGIRKGEDYFRIESSWKDELVAVQLNVKFKLGDIRQVECNGQNYKKASDHLGRIPVVMITPNEIYTFIHETEERRKFLNQTLVQLDSEYLHALNQYNKLLVQKMSLLKQRKIGLKEDEIVLDSYEAQMAKNAMIIFNKRNELVESIQTLLNNYSLKISKGNQESKLEYYSDANSNNLLEIWKKERDLDRFKGRVHSGIHRDKLECIFNGESLKNYGSQGQIKTFVMALRLAQINYLMQHSKNKPIILLDDVFAKLDEKRVMELISLILEIGIEQCFITDTHLERANKFIAKKRLPASVWNLQNQNIELNA